MAGQTGIRVRHTRTCRALEGGRCSCKPSYEAAVFSVRDGKKIRKTFTTQAAAKQWRADATSAISRGGMRAGTPTTLREAADAYIAGMRAGTIRTRKGHPYKPSVIRGYEWYLQRSVLPDLGAHKLTAITSADLQTFIDRMLAEGAGASTIRNTLMPLRAIYRRASRPGGEVLVNPTRGLEIPAANGTRDRIATPAEAETLIRLLTKFDQALWATAFYAGLRRGELLALEWACVDLASGVIRVERAFDPRDKVFINVKTEAGHRRVPIAAVLRDYLIEHKLTSGRSEGLVFGVTPERPFDTGAARLRARRAWARVDAVPCGGTNRDGSPCRGTPKTGGAFCWRHKQLAQAPAPKQKPTHEPIGLHEARHTFASLMIDAGVNIKAISTFMGHASITTTIDRYGHLMPGGVEEAATRLNAYLQRANSQARLAQIASKATASAAAAATAPTSLPLRRPQP